MNHGESTYQVFTHFGSSAANLDLQFLIFLDSLRALHWSYLDLIQFVLIFKYLISMLELCKPELRFAIILGCLGCKWNVYFCGHSLLPRYMLCITYFCSIFNTWLTLIIEGDPPATGCKGNTKRNTAASRCESNTLQFPAENEFYGFWPSMGQEEVRNVIRSLRKRRQSIPYVSLMKIIPRTA